MGGHGGLNILPQKRWHLYRRDNRERVARDERRAREEAEQTRRGINQERLDGAIEQLRTRASTLSTSSCNNDIPHTSLEATAPISSCSEGRGDAVRIPSCSRRRADADQRRDGEGPASDGGVQSSSPSRGAQRHGGRTQGTGGKHFNLFEAEEKEYNKRADAHKKYLDEIGHDEKNEESAFNSCKSVEAPWYTLKPPSVRRLEAHIAESRSAAAPATNSIPVEPCTYSSTPQKVRKGVLAGWASVKDEFNSERTTLGTRRSSSDGDSSSDNSSQERNEDGKVKEKTRKRRRAKSGGTPSRDCILSDGSHSISKKLHKRKRLAEKETRKREHHKVKSDVSLESVQPDRDKGKGNSNSDLMRRLRLERLEREAREKQRRLEVYRKHL